MGAKAALKGYRLQALYTIFRILNSENSHTLTFQPEGNEDLAIFAQTGELLETIQVKAYSENLTISTLTKFFHRVVKLHDKSPQTVVKIVSFGPIGPEMKKAWETNDNERSVVTQKLCDRGLSQSDVDIIFHSVKLVKVNEEQIRDSVFKFLSKSLAGGEPENAFALLNHWLYLASENKEKITYDVLLEKINAVGKYLSERAAHHQEWFTSIVPIEDISISDKERRDLSEEFYQGIDARYKHILAEVDIVRDDKLQEIEEAFHKAGVVIIRGASGQGKSTLAYRYLHDFVPEQLRFEIRLVEDRQHALRIARALAGHLSVVNVPMYVYVDVSPRDEDWTELLRELAQYRNLYLLVTAREEDWKRASISRADLSIEEIELSFDETEARKLYPKLVSRRTPEQFLSFDEAWSKFGSSGPLLEFVYLVAQNESLHERLTKQVQRLQDEVREEKISPNELELLRLVSVPSAYEARVDLKLLVEKLKLPAPERTLDLFEREYLIRRSKDGRYIEGLHPIRSSILTELLTDPVLTPWSDVASACLPIIAENELEPFLLHVFYRHRNDIPKLLEALWLYQPKTWSGISGVLRALLWLGVWEYTVDNQELISEAFERFGSGWSFMLDFNIANLSSELTAWWKDLDIIPDQMKDEITDFRNRQTKKDKVFTYAEKWLSKHEIMPNPPNSLSDWSGLAETNFLVGYLHVDSQIPSFVTEFDWDKVIDTLPLRYLADIVFSLSFTWDDDFYKWLDKNRECILNRFMQETRTVAIEDDGETIRAHFIVDFEYFEDKDENNHAIYDVQSNRLHDKALQIIELLRGLIPNRQNYGCQGYGHRLRTLSLPFDDTEKTGISVELLPPPWAVKINSIFTQLGSYLFRKETWAEYAQIVFRLRETVLNSLQELQRALIVYFRKQKAVNIFRYINSDRWEQYYLTVSSPPLLPQCAVDEWGFTGEGMSDQENIKVVSQFLKKTENVLALWRYKTYLYAFRDFKSSVSNFYQQSKHVLVLNPILGKNKSLKDKEKIQQIAVEQGIKTDQEQLSTYNLFKALKTLSLFQEKFRLHFSQFFDERLLNDLEQRERDIFTKTWSLWYQFAFHPSRIYQNAEQEAFEKLNNALSQMRRDIRRRFRKLSKEGVQAEILSEDILWEGQPALWIKLDISNPVDLYTFFESVISELKKAMNAVKSDKLKKYALEFWWSMIVIVPLIKGKSLTQTVWRIPVSVFFSENIFSEDAWWNYVPHPVPPEYWEKLDLPLWENPHIELVNQLQSLVATLSLMVDSICDFDRLPKVDEQGEKILQDYLKDQSSNIDEIFQQMSDRMAEMMKYFNSLTTEEQKRHPALLESIQVLIEMQENIMPSDDLDGELKMDLANIKEWMERLEKAIEQAEIIRLHWSADVLDLSKQNE